MGLLSNKSPWWRGTRGEWFVAAQIVLIALVFFGPRTLPGLPAWPALLVRCSVFVGVALLIAGGCMFVAGIFKLGSGLTPLPYPRPHAILIQTGPYRLVRHPIYTGGIALAFGWAFIVCGWLTLCYAAVLLIFLDIKSSREELWLMEKFEGYRDYQKRVRKLIPFVR